MKKYIPILCCFFFFSLSCKKKVEDKQKELLIEAMVNGVWQVEKYLEGTLDITSDFSGYTFQFHENGSVTGTKTPASVTGTWSGDATNYSITSNFPTATDAVKKLNGVWKLTDSYWDYVDAKMTTSTGMNILHLRKKP